MEKTKHKLPPHYSPFRSHTGNGHYEVDSTRVERYNGKHAKPLHFSFGTVLAQVAGSRVGDGGFKFEFWPNELHWVPNHN
jgi:hypothetical protein